MLVFNKEGRCIVALHLVANGNSNICLIKTLDKSGPQVLFSSYSKNLTCVSMVTKAKPLIVVAFLRVVVSSMQVLFFFRQKLFIIITHKLWNAARSQ